MYAHVKISNHNLPLISSHLCFVFYSLCQFFNRIFSYPTRFLSPASFLQNPVTVISFVSLFLSFSFLCSLSDPLSVREKIKQKKVMIKSGSRNTPGWEKKCAFFENLHHPERKKSDFIFFLRFRSSFLCFREALSGRLH